MNKFFSFEITFANGVKSMGNMCLHYGSIEGFEDVAHIETYIKQKLNVGEAQVDPEIVVDIITLINWKAM